MKTKCWWTSPYSKDIENKSVAFSLISSICLLRFKCMANVWILFVKLRVTGWQTDTTKTKCLQIPFRGYKLFQTEITCRPNSLPPARNTCSVQWTHTSVRKIVGVSGEFTSVYDKRDDFGFPIVNFPWLSGDVPRLPSYGIYISQLVRFARCCTSVLDFHSKNLQITSKLLTQGYRYHKLRKTFGKFFRSYSELLSKFGDISFQEYVFKGISHPVFYGDLVYKLRRVKDTPNFISSGSKIVKRLRRRQYDPLIIETTIGLVLGPCTALCRLFLKHCTLTNKAVGTIWRALSKPPQRRQGPDLRPLWLLVGTPSAIRPELAFSRAEHSLPYSDVTIYIFAILYLSSMPYV